MLVVSLRRFFDQSGFDARGLFDETQALLRYAQKPPWRSGGRCA